MWPSDQRSCVFAAVLQPWLVRWARSCPALISSQQARWPRVAAVPQPDGRRFNSPNSQFPKSACPSGQKLLTCASVHPARAELPGGAWPSNPGALLCDGSFVREPACFTVPPCCCHQRPQLHAAAAAEISPPFGGKMAHQQPSTLQFRRPLCLIKCIHHSSAGALNTR